LAKKSGVSRVSINRYELGTRVPDVTVAIKLAQALNHSVEEVFSRMQKEAAR
jgi:DNA-binding XRE family transcriptional regulator